MPYVVRGKCVYKKGKGGKPGKKVGCTKGSIKKYLAALHMHADESLDRELTKEDLEEIIREAVADVADVEDVESATPTTLLKRKPDPLKIEYQPEEDYTQRPIGLRGVSTEPKSAYELAKSTLQHVRDVTPFGVTVGGKQIALNKGARWKGLGAENPKYTLSLTGKFGGEKGITLEQIIREELEKLLHEQTI